MLKTITVLSFFLLLSGFTHAELPKSVQIDQKQVLIGKALKNKESIDCPAVIEHGNDLERLTSKKLPATFYYYRASCLSQSGSNQKALQDLETYFSVNKKKGDIYQKALVLYSEIDVKAAEENDINRLRETIKNSDGYSDVNKNEPVRFYSDFIGTKVNWIRINFTSWKKIDADGFETRYVVEGHKTVKHGGRAVSGQILHNTTEKEYVLISDIGNKYMIVYTKFDLQDIDWSPNTYGAMRDVK
jgi:hypothetical protein